MNIKAKIKGQTVRNIDFTLHLPTPTPFTPQFNISIEEYAFYNSIL